MSLYGRYTMLQNTAIDIAAISTNTDPVLGEEANWRVNIS